MFRGVAGAGKAARSRCRLGAGVDRPARRRPLRPGSGSRRVRRRAECRCRVADPAGGRPTPSSSTMITSWFIVLGREPHRARVARACLITLVRPRRRPGRPPPRPRPAGRPGHRRAARSARARRRDRARPDPRSAAARPRSKRGGPQPVDKITHLLGAAVQVGGETVEQRRRRAVRRARHCGPRQPASAHRPDRRRRRRAGRGEAGGAPPRERRPAVPGPAGSPACCGRPRRPPQPGRPARAAAGSRRAENRSPGRR